MPLVVATHNTHKVEELRALLGDRQEVLSLSAFPALPAPEETGRTFLANATIKALAAATVLGPAHLVLADDSGLEVDVLGGAPGVDSALYSGRHGDDAGHRAKLLAELARVGATTPAQRTARFRCVLVLARGPEILATAEGSVEGVIAEQEQGSGGFGYDSLFIPTGYLESFGLLPAAVKNTLSHRARALADLLARWPESAL
jgi:XTP/dITP diphosphohydrolase